MKLYMLDQCAWRDTGGEGLYIEDIVSSNFFTMIVKVSVKPLCVVPSAEARFILTVRAPATLAMS